MKSRHMFLLIAAVLCSADAVALSFDDLRPDVPACKMPPGRRPKLPAEKGPDSKELLKIGWYTTMLIDFNGDGWCDFAIGVPYPFNSQMDSYDVPDVISFGTPRGWRFVPRGTIDRVIKAQGFGNGGPLAVFRVDLRGIKLVFPEKTGAPFILGLYRGVPGTERDPLSPECTKYSVVFRWNDTKDAFEQIEKPDADVVLKYYYTVMRPECGVALEKRHTEQRR